MAWTIAVARRGWQRGFAQGRPAVQRGDGALAVGADGPWWSPVLPMSGAHLADQAVAHQVSKKSTSGGVKYGPSSGHIR
jgi:hypothetical protein